MAHRSISGQNAFVVIGGGAAAGTMSSALIRGGGFAGASFRSDDECAARAGVGSLAMPVQAT